MSSLVCTFESNLDDVLPGLNTDEYQAKVKNFKDAITINTQRIEAKVKEPTTVASLEDTDSLLLEIGSIIDQMNDQIEAHNTLVGDKKNQQSKCSKEVWEYLAFVLQDAVKEYNDTLANADKELNALKTELNNLRTKDGNITTDISNLNKQVVNTEATIEGINRILKTSGFQGFYLRAKKDVQNTYEVIRPDGTIAEKLSEGERNFIAFLYFYHLVRGSFSDKEVKDKIVVIDDPVSSMDKATNFVQKKGEEHKSADLVADPVMKLPTAEHFGLTEDKEKRLSEIIDEINSRTGKNYDNDVVVKAMLQIRDILMKSDKLKTSARNNTQQDFEFSYFDDIDDALIEGLSQNQDFFSMLLSNDEMKRQVLGIFSDEIYKSLRNAK